VSTIGARDHKPPAVEARDGKRSVVEARDYQPSALGGSLRRFWELTATLAISEFKLRYFGSALGYLWSLMRPLLFFGVLYLFFTEIVHVGAGVPHYGVYLLTSIVLWNYFGEATTTSVASLVTREALLRKIHFPRMAIPLSVSLTALFNLVMNFIAVIAFAMINGVSPSPGWLELIPIVVGFVILATGFGMLLSAGFVRFRDVAPIWEVLVQAWFYCTPIMYIASEYEKRTAIAKFGHGLVKIAMINPPAALLTQMGHAVIGGKAFPSVVAVGGLPSALGALALILLSFVAGWVVFIREAPRVAENL
jgi:ABC-2 type transport system permease protein